MSSSSSTTSHTSSVLEDIFYPPRTLVSSFQNLDQLCPGWAGLVSRDDRWVNVRMEGQGDSKVVFTHRRGSMRGTLQLLPIRSDSVLFWWQDLGSYISVRNYASQYGILVPFDATCVAFFLERPQEVFPLEVIRIEEMRRE